MEGRMLPGRGPSPWREPVTGWRLSALEVLAWLQLGVLGLMTAWLVAITALLRDLRFCDGGLDCPPPPDTSAAWLLSRAAIWGAVLALGVLAVVVAWRRGHGRASRPAAAAALVAPAVAVALITRIFSIPLF